MFFNRTRKWKPKTVADLQALKPTRTNAPIGTKSDQAIIKHTSGSSDQDSDTLETMEDCFTDLFSSLEKLCLDDFGGSDLWEPRLPWATEFPHEFYHIVEAVACDDPSNGGWDELLRSGNQRVSLVMGIIMKIVDDQIFSSLCFGAEADHSRALEIQDADLINVDCFSRCALRRASNITYLSRTGDVPPHFWSEVDRITQGIAHLLLPLYNLAGVAIADPDRDLQTFYQRLHDFIGRAAKFSHEVRNQESFFTLRWPKPGDTPHEDHMHLRQDLLKESRAQAQIIDGGIRIFHREAKVKMCLFPAVFENVLKDENKIHEKRILSAGVVYYSAYFDESKEFESHISLENHARRSQIAPWKLYEVLKYLFLGSLLTGFLLMTGLGMRVRGVPPDRKVGEERLRLEVWTGLFVFVFFGGILPMAGAYRRWKRGVWRQ